MDTNTFTPDLKRLNKRLWKTFHQACQQYLLLQDNDHILIGLSGGKDSLLLTELLGRQARIFVPHIQVTAAHIRIQNRNYLSNTQALEQFCQQAGVPLVIHDTQIVGEEQKEPCFLCSWYRRKALFQLAEQLGCNKIALGHHRDDILQTLLLNLIYQGHFGTIPPILPMEKMPLALIRPLCLMDEKDILQYATLRQYPQQEKKCQFEKLTARTKARLILEQCEQLNPNVRDSLWKAMENIKTPYLPRSI